MRFQATPTRRVAQLYDRRDITPRHALRVLDLPRLAREVTADAARAGQPLIEPHHGGAVSDHYGYPASTDAVLTVAWPDGRAVVAATRIPANKVTNAGAAAAAGKLLDIDRHVARTLFDGRYKGDPNTATALLLVLAERAWRDQPPTHIAINGVLLSAATLAAPELTVELIDDTPNLEERRLLTEIFGFEQLMRAGGASLLRSDSYGTLWVRRRHASRRWDGDVEVALEVVNSTPEPDGSHKRYMLRVPPDMRSPHEAVAWTFGLRPAEYVPDAES